MNRWFVLGLFVVQSACLPDKKVASPPETPATTQVAPVAETVVADVSKGHVAPTLADIPNDEFGESVRRGAAIFFDTPTHAAQFTGNSQSCANCHIDGGRMADSGPMWAAWGVYPAYRKKNGHVNTMEERLQGCFTYSENAQA